MPISAEIGQDVNCVLGKLMSSRHFYLINVDQKSPLKFGYKANIFFLKNQQMDRQTLRWTKID